MSIGQNKLLRPEVHASKKVSVMTGSSRCFDLLLWPNAMACQQALEGDLTQVMHAGKEVSVNMEYNRQVAVGGAAAAEAAKAKGTTADQKDMAFATVTLAEKDNNGQQKSSNVSPDYCPEAVRCVDM